VKPIGALLRGIFAGALGSGAQELFFRATSRLAPSGGGGFEPVEAEQAGEMPTQTVARRLVEGLARRGPLGEKAKRRAGEAVEVGFGAAWGGLYGLLRESFPAAGRLAGVAGFSAAVAGVSNGVIVPLFRVGPWPHRVPLRSHGYYLASHLAYGAVTALAYEALRRRPLSSAVALAVALRARFGRGRRWPAWARPALRRGAELFH
jgi:hypothetical protein